MIIHGDCLNEIRKLPDNSIDAIVTDPPYCSGGVLEAQKQSSTSQGIREDSNQRFAWFSGNNMTTSGISYLIRELSVECDRVLKDGGSFLVFSDWRMIINFVPAIESAGFIYRNLIVWNKGHIGMGNGFRNQHELIGHFVKGGSPEFHNASTGNVINVSRTMNKTERIHPTEKPVELLSKILKVVTKQGDVVLDPFFGSGSLGEACIRMKRNFIGIEKSTIHYENSFKRIDETKLKMSNELFEYEIES